MGRRSSLAIALSLLAYVPSAGCSRGLAPHEPGYSTASTLGEDPGPGPIAIGPSPASDDQRADGLYAYTEPGELPQIVLEGGPMAGAQLPLEHTAVDAHTRGPFAEVKVAQRFSNPHPEPIEVTYTFPLPENSAVSEMRMRIGARTIEAEIKTREEALEVYDEAREAGHTAALLEQERPNIFTQSVANIAPGETIEVEISYLQTLSQDAGVYEFVFPMVVGPRFIPGVPTGTRSGEGIKADTARVPDAARITPPILGRGERTGHDVSLKLTVDAGQRIDAWQTPTHTVLGRADAKGFAIELADAQTIPNRDFVARWAAAGDQSRAQLFLGAKDAEGEGSFALLVQPPKMDLDATVGRREMIFVVDRSGSMHGVPLALAKQTLRQSLAALRPVDTFDVVGFASGTDRLFGTPRPANAHNLMLAERFIDGMQSGGGTMMASAVEAALAPPIEAGRRRYVMFLTDGYVGNEDEILRGSAHLVRAAKRAGTRARVFGVGIGSAPNRHLIDGFADTGDGLGAYVTNREHPAEVVEKVRRYTDSPVLEHLDIDWGSLKVSGTHPSALPDLFAAHPVVVLGRYRGEAPAELKLRAELSGPKGKDRRVTLPIQVSSATEDSRLLSTLWAREKIADLQSSFWDGVVTADELKTQTTEVGLEHHLVTAYTSLVAVDRSRVVGDGNPEMIVQPVEVPEAVDAVMAGAVSPSYSGTTLSVNMDQAKNIPVGANTSRDFTAVADLAPSATRDSAGISLAGTTSAESYYAIEGGSVGEGKARAWMAMADIETPTAGSGLRLRGLLSGSRHLFNACYEQRVVDPGRGRVTLEVALDAKGRFESLRVVDEGLGSDYAHECLEAVLARLDWSSLELASRTVSFTLKFWMR